MRHFRLVLFALPLALSACGIPDLVAHGVKSYENRDNAPAAQPAADQSVQPPPASGQVEPPAPAEPDETPAAGGYRREEVTPDPVK
ncbi:MAG: hypothetical protein M0006_12860 [Magnetospirillum sp.]|nr:hypothetical protein [Magnetospirillum sp.]